MGLPQLDNSAIRGAGPGSSGSERLLPECCLRATFVAASSPQLAKGPISGSGSHFPELTPCWGGDRDSDAHPPPWPAGDGGCAPDPVKENKKKKEKQNQRPKDISLFLFLSDISRESSRLANFYAVIGCESQLSIR
jgi:hypothetical protein